MKKQLVRLREPRRRCEIDRWRVGKLVTADDIDGRIVTLDQTVRVGPGLVLELRSGSLVGLDNSLRPDSGPPQIQFWTGNDTPGSGPSVAKIGTGKL